MKNLSQLAYKIGAGIVVAILVVMMGITFSSQPISEITSVISGTSTVGSFQGQGIEPRLFRSAYRECEQIYSRYQDIPDYFIQNCAVQRLQSYHTFPEIGKELGLRVSDAEVEERLVEEVKNIYDQESVYSDPDDRRTMKQIYMAAVEADPLAMRKARLAAGTVARAFSDFPYPDSVARANVRAEQIQVSLSVLYFNNASLLRSLGKKVLVTEEEARQLYEEKKYDTEDGEKPTFASQKELLMNEVRNEKRQKALAEVKGKLSSLQNPKMQEITSITFIQPYNPGPLSLMELKAVPTGGKDRVDLTVPDALIAIAGGASERVHGPISAGDYTAYIKVNRILGEKAPVSYGKVEKQKQNGSRFLAQSLLEILSEHEADKGKFKLNRGAIPDQSSGGPSGTGQFPQ